LLSALGRYAAGTRGERHELMSWRLRAIGPRRWRCYTYVQVFPRDAPSLSARAGVILDLEA
jgi:hypothetical protein